MLITEASIVVVIMTSIMCKMFFAEEIVVMKANDYYANDLRPPYTDNCKPSHANNPTVSVGGLLLV